MLLKNKIVQAGMLVTAMSLGANAALAADCGKVTIADMSWASAEFAAYLDKIVLEKGYGCEVELVPSDTLPAITSMTEKGEPDIASELWMNSGREVVDKAIADKKLVVLGDILEDGGEEGFWVPKYFADAHPEIKSVADVFDHPDLFPAPEDKTKGGMMTCPPGWGCQPVTNNFFKAFGGEKKGWVLVDPGSGAGLDGAIAKAYERKEPWFGYYWAPTAILGKYPMTKLALDYPYDEKNWKDCLTKESCADPKLSSWVKSEVRTVVTTTFAERAPGAVEYMKKRTYKNAMLNEVLAWMGDQKGTGEDGARHFLKTKEDIWTQWVPEDVATKIKAGL